MRIVGGEWRGRPLSAPAGLATRPTADRVREAMFNLLLHSEFAGGFALSGARVLDAFAGTGALGLEALSRGAAHAVFFEKERAAQKVLSQNIATLKAEERCEILRCDALSPPAPNFPADLILLDPPYGEGLIEKAIGALLAQGWISPSAVLMTEARGDEVLALPPEFTALKARLYGDTRVTLWERNA